MARKTKKQASIKRRMNNTAILSFYNSRVLLGDGIRLSEETNYSTSHISNVKAGRRRINDTIANAMYYISRKRVKQEVAA